MRPIWLLESNVDGLNTAEIQAEVRRQGMSCHIVKHLPSYAIPKDIAGAESLRMDECVIFRGSLNLMRHIHASRRWTPGGWCAVQNLSCSTYYAHFGPFLLNRDYAFLPMAEVIRLADDLFLRYAKEGKLFVRPDTVYKRFPGTLTDRTSFMSRFHGSEFDPTQLVLVARAKKSSYEWRLIVCNSRVIAGSQYRSPAGRDELPHCPDEVISFAADVLQNVRWRPAPIFVLDVCDSEDGLRVQELNSFGCSGHYLADVATVVEAASNLAAITF